MMNYRSIIKPLAGRKKPGYLIELYCPTCGRIFTASRIGTACKSCTEPNTYPADRLPCLDIGKKVTTKNSLARKDECTA